MIEVKNLTKSYKDCIAINNVDLSIPTGRFVVITGRSGSGKSTLLKCMSGLITPSDGQVLIDGHDIHKLTNTEKSKFRNTKTGYIFQSFALEPKYTAYENIELPMIIKGEKNAIRKARVYEVAGFVGISDLLSKRTEILSGGEKQRVAIARALVNDSQILFADEPCGNLDKQNSETIIDLLYKINAKGTTVILVTHQPQDITRSHMQIELLNGRIKENKYDTDSSERSQNK